MSPTRIEDMGGMTRGEINSLVLQNKLDARDQFDTIMDKHTHEINARFDARDSMVDKRFDKLEEALQDSALAQARGAEQLARIGESLANYMDRGLEWHNDELENRRKLATELSDTNKLLAKNAQDIQMLKPEVASIRKHQEEAKKSLQRMSWLFDAVKVMSKVGSAVFTGKPSDDEEKGGKVVTLVSKISAIFVGIWIFVHQIIPKVYFYAVQGHKFTWWNF